MFSRSREASVPKRLRSSPHGRAFARSRRRRTSREQMAARAIPWDVQTPEIIRTRGRRSICSSRWSGHAEGLLHRPLIRVVPDTVVDIADLPGTAPAGVPTHQLLIRVAPTTAADIAVLKAVAPAGDLIHLLPPFVARPAEADIAVANQAVVRVVVPPAAARATDLRRMAAGINRPAEMAANDLQPDLRLSHLTVRRLRKEPPALLQTAKGNRGGRELAAR